jgi:hypothetical protein
MKALLFPSQTPQDHFRSFYSKHSLKNMTSTEAVLSFVGEPSATDVLDMLDILFENILDFRGRKYERWEIFSVICASGPVG